MISNLVFRKGEKSSKKQLFTTSEKIEMDSEVEVRYFNEELDMLIAWSKELAIIDPDVISGFNVLRFDLSFIYLRMTYLIS